METELMFYMILLVIVGYLWGRHDGELTIYRKLKRKKKLPLDFIKL